MSSTSFFWVFDCKNNMYKIWPKWEESQASRPVPHGVSCSSLVKVLMSTNAKPIQCGFIQNAQTKFERLEPCQDGSTCSNQIQNQIADHVVKEFMSVDWHVGATDSWHEPEIGRPAHQRPAGPVTIALDQRNHYRPPGVIKSVHIKAVEIRRRS